MYFDRYLTSSVIHVSSLGLELIMALFFLSGFGLYNMNVHRYCTVTEVTQSQKNYEIIRSKYILKPQQEVNEKCSPKITIQNKQ